MTEPWRGIPGEVEPLYGCTEVALLKALPALLRRAVAHGVREAIGDMHRWESYRTGRRRMEDFADAIERGEVSV